MSGCSVPLRKTKGPKPIARFDPFAPASQYQFLTDDASMRARVSPNLTRLDYGSLGLPHRPCLVAVIFRVDPGPVLQGSPRSKKRGTLALRGLPPTTHNELPPDGGRDARQSATGLLRPSANQEVRS